MTLEDMKLRCVALMFARVTAATSPGDLGIRYMPVMSIESWYISRDEHLAQRVKMLSALAGMPLHIVIVLSEVRATPLTAVISDSHALGGRHL
jgi:hypothetical protein